MECVGIGFFILCFNFQMSHVVTTYKNLNVDQVDLTIPEKIHGKYVSYISSNKNPLFVQSPTLNFVSCTDSTMTFAVKKSSPFSQRLQVLDNWLIDYIIHHSKRFFNGKLFSREKVSSSFCSTLKEDNGQHLLTVTIPKEIQVKDQRGKERTLADITPDMECVAILHLEGIQFKSTSMHLMISVPQLKIYCKESLLDWCISADDDGSSDDGQDDSHEAPVPPEIIEEKSDDTTDSPTVPTTSDETDALKGETNIAESTTEKQNDDHLNFF